MNKFLLTVLRIELIVAPIIIGWAIYEYCQCQETERELQELFTETKVSLEAIN